MADIILKDFSILNCENKTLFNKVKNNMMISLDTSTCEVFSSSNQIEPILEIKKGEYENEVIIITFGYIGRFSAFGVNFDIGYRFGNNVLDKMIARVNDIEIKSLTLEANTTKNKNKSDNLALRILYMQFIFKLERLSILGLPKQYIKQNNHKQFRGQIDINRYIKKDIPFQGHISSVSYEQKYIQEIIDVLYCALREVEKSFKDLVIKRVFQIRNIIFNYSNKVLINQQTLTKALQHKVLNNSLYSEFKSILEIANYIITHNFNISYKNNIFTKGLLFDVSILWERYLYKLLKEHFEPQGWIVIHEEKNEVYQNQFFSRKLIPDIIMKKDNQILVFDAKSKSMKFKKGIGNGSYGDLDRSDFFQINTYMTYYKNKGYNVLAGGLLYPMEEKYDKNKCFSDNWFGDEKTKFIIDGIEIIGDEIKEKEFIKRIEELIN